MHRRWISLAAALLLLAPATFSSSPKLVVVICLDQFRYEYLLRFSEHFGKDGFVNLLERGANFTNASYKHATTLTAPGHAALLTGAYGDQNGIIGNNWYDAKRNRIVYCMEDDNAHLVGASGDGVSPSHLIGSTFGDELRICSGFRSKVISVSNKDRAAILLAGKLANGVYWMVDSSFVTSSYYAETLPLWVRKFNSAGLINSYFGRSWERVLPNEAYATMDADDVPYEEGGDGLGRTFPHPITGNNAQKISKSYYGALMTSPFGSEVLLEFAKHAVAEEHLGERGVTDLLCVSFSSNDYVGHSFGPDSHEVLDMTVRTDRIIANLLGYLDGRLGPQSCIIALTSDHGVAPIPEYLLKKFPHADAGRVSGRALFAFAAAALSEEFGPPPAGRHWLESTTNNISINAEVAAFHGVPVERCAAHLAERLEARPEIACAFTRKELESQPPKTMLEQLVRNSYYRSRSGDVVFVLKPYYVMGEQPTGTSHGEPYDYSAHVPLIIVGPGVRHGTFADEVSPTDLAPTLSALLRIEFPAGREGKVLTEALLQK